MSFRVALGFAVLSPLVLTSGCGGGGGGDGTTPPPTPSPGPSATPLVRVSQGTTFPANCDGVPAEGTLYVGAAVEPDIAINPTSPANLLGSWQQNRWSTGGAQGLMFGVSFDGGVSWTLSHAPTSRCTGGNAGNGGDYARASDPWVTFAANGTAYALSLSFTGDTLAPGSSSAMLVSRSADGGVTWSTPTTLIRDGSTFFNDKGSITADPADARFVYAVWDRTDASQHGPTFMGMTSDGGATWQPGRSIYDPGAGNQTLGNQIVVLAGGKLVNLFTEIDVSSQNGMTSSLRAIRSGDHGTTWDTPVKIADLLAVGASDPQTHTGVRDGSDLAAVATDAAGVIYVVWQDARFSNGQRDGIAFSRSTDGGVTWAAPIQVNTATTTQAFTPAVNVRSDGVIAVTYYDFRNDTPDPNTLLTNYWMVTSRDGAQWTETAITGPFDLDLAANAEGLFLGDYAGLTSTAGQFLPFFVRPLISGQAHQTEAYLANTGSSKGAAATTTSAAAAAPPLLVTAEWRERVQQRARRTLLQRRMGATR